MGLLDEAIREHLDLKRRRGADPADIERAEREALGPVRRGPEETETEEPQFEEGLAYEDEHAAPYDEEPSASGPFDAENGAYDDQRAAPYDERQGGDWGEAFDNERESRGHARYDDPFADEEDPFDEPQAAATPPPHPAQADQPPGHGAHPTGGETVEYDVKGAATRKGGKDEEDVLEETPEFLQDTPDHDRLWFEQKPPKDFDFDG